MGITSRLKATYQHLFGKKYIKTIKRKQFNLNMAEDVVLGVKLIAVILEVPYYVACEHPYYVACEHMLQVGSYEVMKAIDDPEKRQKLTEHLVEVHLLGDELKDNETILKLGQD